MTVDIIGGTKREEACRAVLLGLKEILSLARITVLPIPSSRDGVCVSGTDVELSGALSDMREGDAVACYGLGARITRELCERGCEVLDVSEDERFVEENAILTAECTLSYIMSHSERSLLGMKVGVIGYGRIGSELVRLLMLHGVGVCAVTGRQSVREELLFLGARAALVSEWDPSGYDIVVNTAPAVVLSRAAVERIGCPILELAPGENFFGAVNLTRLPSLPAKMLPESAGKAYADAIIRAHNKGVNVN